MSLRIVEWHISIVALAASLYAAGGCAGGFAIVDQSASSAARASAGNSSGVNDASAVFYNAASMMLLPHGEAQLGLGAGSDRLRYVDSNSTDAIGGPMRGGTATDMGIGAVGDIFVVLPVATDVRAGLAVTSPFGESIGYQQSWVGRYFVTQAKLETVDLGLSLARAVADGWSIGAGVDRQWARVSRTSMIDFGSICFATIAPSVCTGAGLTPQSADGELQLRGDSWAWGFNLGLLYDVPDVFRIGISYRSKMGQTFRGDAVFQVPTAASPLLGTGAFRDTGASTTLILPESANVGATYNATHDLTLYGGFIWTRWSRINQFVVEFDNPAQPVSSEVFAWRNTIRTGIAFDYRLNDQLSLSSGLSFDPSPIPVDRRKSILPQGNQLVLGAGVTWMPSANTYAIVSYNCLFQRDTNIDEAVLSDGRLQGAYSSRTQGVGISAGIRF